MSGHSHWAGIKHKKVWSKIARMIIVAAKNGGGDPAANLTLRYSIDKAKAANMPKDTIEKAIKKGTGELEGVTFEEVLYEGYGPSGVAIMVEALTDNRNRTGPEVKKLFEKHGGSLGTSGCVSWMFSQKGLITIATAGVDEERLLEIALNAGADDMDKTGELFEITCEPAAFEGLKKALDDEEITTEVAEIAMIPQNTVEVNQEAVAKRIIALMESFDDHDDIQNAYANFDIPDEIVANIS